MPNESLNSSEINNEDNLLEELPQADISRIRNRSQGARALGAVSELPTRENIAHPIRVVSKRDIPTHEERQQSIDQERNARRGLKESNKYANEFYSTRMSEEAIDSANLPLYEETNIEPAESRIESYETGLERALDKASFRLNKHFEEYYIEGAAKSLSEGKLEINPKGFITDAFIDIEGSDIDRSIPENDRTQFWDDYKYDVISEKVKDLNQEANLKQVEKEALETALERGATVERNSLDEPEQVRFSLPIMEYGDGGLQNFMKEYGIDLESKEVQQASFEGFIGILDAIKNHKEYQKDGFKALDWYYDNFHYKDNLAEKDGFIDRINGHMAFADWEWRQTLLEYLKNRKEYKEEEEKVNSDEQRIKDIENIVESEPISPETYTKQVSEILGIPEEVLKNPKFNADVIQGKFLPPEPKSLVDKGEDTPTKPNYYRYPKTYGKQKIFTMHAIFMILTLSCKDENADIRISEEQWANKENFTVLRFGCDINRELIERSGGSVEDYPYSSENHIIAESDNPASATYGWHGQGDEWEAALINRYRTYAKSQPGVFTRNHDHSKTPMDHMIGIFKEMGIDLIELSKQMEIPTEAKQDDLEQQNNIA